LVFVGDGPLHQEILSARKNGDSVHILGWIKDKAVMARLMASADLFVLPSVHETWGAVVNEAMTVGTPVLASDKVGAAQDMITHDHNGFLYQCGDIVACSQTLTLALQSTQKEAIIAAAKATATAFGHEYAVKNLRQAVSYAQQENEQNINWSRSSRICGKK
ncbi:MAG: glycosyltransferase, partial [Candidatus Electrothrix sp. ATG1]|nr:glycosyltransferase [Candidatus Electrothrix sp. ATG1]